jgi:hypothetical protein
VEWSWTAWALSVAAVIASAAAAWFEGCLVRRPGLDMGFANHGGMWGDLIWLPIANAVIVPHLTWGRWAIAAAAIATTASVWVHYYWYRGTKAAHSCEHMWPARPHGTWRRDLSAAGWLHVFYVIGELTLLIGFLVHSIPPATVLTVAAIFTLHISIGLLQPRWFLSGQIASWRQQPLLLPCLAALWLISAAKF